MEEGQRNNFDQADANDADRKRKKASFSKPGDREHETHVPALILLVLVTLVIIGVVLIYSDDLKQGESPTSTTTPTTSQMDPRTGSAVPTEQAETTDQSGVSGFPGGLSLPNDAEVVRNYSTQLSGDRTQRIIIFDTQEQVSALVSRYESWANDAGLTIDRAESANDSGAVVAGDDTGQVTVAISTNDGSRRVQINYVAQ